MALGTRPAEPTWSPGAAEPVLFPEGVSTHHPALPASHDSGPSNQRPPPGLPSPGLAWTLESKGRCHTAVSYPASLQGVWRVRLQPSYKFSERSCARIPQPASCLLSSRPRFSLPPPASLPFSLPIFSPSLPSFLPTCLSFMSPPNTIALPWPSALVPDLRGSPPVLTAPPRLPHPQPRPILTVAGISRVPRARNTRPGQGASPSLPFVPNGLIAQSPLLLSPLPTPTRYPQREAQGWRPSLTFPACGGPCPAGAESN